ncbi:hypothetical protein BO94DRAFT_548023 [Aspergillus sclerotioniger CBS 115572]|uniref:Uncharacterized protein n=1 Tax=Aspergillus sclerotioniger CBS 115572 TaxID=1450535 RepID=A0A317W7V4_9EURO|nr:hypothetical protein BO94DRAFT_548023 [Aspergillus sclerotioniger CBS 115572]PWY81761.1 hypothetical protein BO94DRAFT_548023 [Aspergillus sclerotioniger CBS 115572]
MKPTHTLAFLALCAGLSLAAPGGPGMLNTDYHNIAFANIFTGADSNQHLDVHGVHGRDGISASGDIKAHVGRREIFDSNDDLPVHGVHGRGHVSGSGDVDAHVGRRQDDGYGSSVLGHSNERRNDIGDVIGDVVHARDNISGSGKAGASLSGEDLNRRQKASAGGEEDVGVHGVRGRGHVSGSADADAH